MIIALLVSVVTANPSDSCPTSMSDFYDPQTQLCCSNGVTDRLNEHDQELDCCDGKHKSFNYKVCGCKWKRLTINQIHLTASKRFI